MAKQLIKRNVATSKTIISDAFEEFIVEKEALGMVASTIRSYSQSYLYFIRWLQKYKGIDADTEPVDNITKEHILGWVARLNYERTKETTINHYLRDVKAFLYWCMADDREYIERPYKIQLVKGQEELPKMYSDDEIEVLLKKPANDASFIEWRTWAIVNWVLGTGNRSGTVCEVKVEDIDFNKKTVYLRHTKNKKAQVIPLSPALEKVLKEYRRIWQIDDFLFPDAKLEQLTTNALRHSFARYCNNRGISRTNIHGLRHNFAKMWVVNGGSDTMLMYILGHSSLTMTQRYIKLYCDDVAEDFEVFNPLDNLKRASARKQMIKRN